MSILKPCLAGVVSAYAILVTVPAEARTGPAKLLIDVDFYDTLGGVRPYCGSNWIDRFFAGCPGHGVRRVTWRCHGQLANFPSKLNYRWSELDLVKSAADERRSDGAFAAKVGVGPQKPGEFGGIVQRMEIGKPGMFLFRGMVGSDALPAGAFLAVVDVATGKVLARSDESRSYGLCRLEVRFQADGPVDAGVFSSGAADTHVFVADNLSMRPIDDPGAELLVNGSMEEVDKFMEPSGWKQRNARFVVLNGDVTAIPEAQRKKRFPNLGGFTMLYSPYRNIMARIQKAEDEGDSLELAGKAAKRHGVELFAWIDPFDDGRRCLPPVKCWSSRFLEEHPELRCTDSKGRARWGLLCFACPEVRAYKTAMVREVLSYEGVAGVAIKTHYQHNMLWGLSSMPQRDCLYHPAILERYHARWGRPKDGKYLDFNLRALHGEAVMEWLRELRPIFKAAGKRLCMFQAPRPYLDSSMTCGWYLPPERIIVEKLCDDMLIEPRWMDGDHLKHFAGPDGDSVKRLIRTCREAGVGVGFDVYYTAIRSNNPEKCGEELYRQLVALSREDVDYLGIYEENHFRSRLKFVDRAAAEIAQMPADARTVDYSDIEDKSPNLSRITPETCREVVLEDGSGRKLPADELVVDGTVGDPLWAEWLGASPSNSHLTVSFRKPIQLSRVSLYTGHLRWKTACAAEDFTLWGLAGGEWEALSSVTGANAMKGKDQTVPNVCEFERRLLDAIRIDFTRGSRHSPAILVRRVTGR